jgi:hypothetical protein
VVWLLVALTMKTPKYLKSKIVSLKELGPNELEHFVERVSNLEGVHEVSVYELDRVAYLKVDKGFDDTELQALLAR